MPAPHHSSFYRPDSLPAAQPTAKRQSTEGWEYYRGKSAVIHGKTAVTGKIFCQITAVITGWGQPLLEYRGNGNIMSGNFK